MITIELDPTTIKPRDIDLVGKTLALRKKFGKDVIIGMSTNGSTVLLHCSRPLTMREIDTIIRDLNAKDPPPPPMAKTFASLEDALEFLQQLGISISLRGNMVIVERSPAAGELK